MTTQGPDVTFRNKLGKPQMSILFWRQESLESQTGLKLLCRKMMTLNFSISGPQI